jgi:hypothetical protein
LLTLRISQSWVPEVPPLEEQSPERSVYVALYFSLPLGFLLKQLLIQVFQPHQAPHTLQKPATQVPSVRDSEPVCHRFFCSLSSSAGSSPDFEKVVGVVAGNLEPRGQSCLHSCPTPPNPQVLGLIFCAGDRQELHLTWVIPVPCHWETLLRRKNWGTSSCPHSTLTHSIPADLKAFHSAIPQTGSNPVPKWTFWAHLVLRVAPGPQHSSSPLTGLQSSLRG